MLRPLIFGRSPTQNVVGLRRRFDAVVRALGQAVGAEFTLKIGASYDATRDAMLDDAYDVALVSPGVWLDAHDRGAHYRPCARAIRRGEREYCACIVAKAGAYGGIAELRGKQLAFVNRASVGGFAAALPIFEDAGLSLEDFERYRFVGGHDNVLRAIQRGSADAGVVFQKAWETFEGVGGVHLSVDVLGTSAPIPNEPIALSERFIRDEPKLAQAVERAVFELHEHELGRRAIAGLNEGISRFVPVSDRPYLEAREMFARAAPDG